MSAKPATAEKNVVTLIRQGIGREEYSLSEGATLADLLRQARARAEDVTISIDGRPLEGLVPLPPGAIVTLTPRPKPVNLGWIQTYGMFRDDPLFQEMVEASRAIREADREAARTETGDDDA